MATNNDSDSLETRLNAAENPATFLRTAPTMPTVSLFPFPAEYSNWRDEQAAWKQTAVMFDQSFHMTDTYFRGPGVKQLLSDYGVNSFSTFGARKAKQYVAVTDRGHYLSDSILFGWSDSEVSVVGTPAVGNWLRYQAERGDYDVEVEVDPWAVANPNRKLFRFQLNGPLTQAIVEKAAAGSFSPIKFFNVGEFAIAGTVVRALNHTMAGVPGDESTGLEITGPYEAGPDVKAALIEAGQEFGLIEGGALSYGSSTVESAWIALPVSGIYTGESFRGYREWLPGEGFEAFASIGGSFKSEDIEDYYVTPWDLGYGNLIKFDHDFFGRDALESLADQPHRRKVWLRWDDSDVARVIASSYFDTPDTRAKYLAAPFGAYAVSQYDEVRIGDRLVGISNWLGYTVNVGGWASLGMVDEADAVDGQEVTLAWGETGPGLVKATVEPHAQTEIRATIHTSPLA